MVGAIPSPVILCSSLISEQTFQTRYDRLRKYFWVQVSDRKRETCLFAVPRSQEIFHFKRYLRRGTKEAGIEDSLSGKIRTKELGKIVMIALKKSHKPAK